MTSQVRHTGVLGAGVIGASWTALFLAAGRSVAVYDAAPGFETSVRRFIDKAWPALDELGLTARATPDEVRFVTSPQAAVADADFIQENVPERLDIKHQTYRAVEGALRPGAVLSSSTSGLTLEALQEPWTDPANLVLGHPFNPPHLIPLVEMTGNARTNPGALDIADAFYTDIGKVTIRIRKGMPGHVANRLQAALWREAVHLALEEVASIEDIDKAIWAGPGLRWSVMGPALLFHLAAGPGGLRSYLHHFKDTYNGWWDEMGEPKLDDAVIDRLMAGVLDEAKGRSVEDLIGERDGMLTAVQAALANRR